MRTTTIAWTGVQDANARWHPGFTFNPWRGCAKVSPGCTHCYAEGMDKRFSGGRHWGLLAPRALQSDAYWQEPQAWNKRARELGVRLRVFCGSVCDWLEAREDLVEVRSRLLELIADTPDLDWLLLTKRPENLRRLTPWCTMAPGNVWLGISAENQEQLDLRLPRIRELGAVVVFVSAEPLLGPITLRGRPPVDWLIVGSERGPGSRRPDDAWLDPMIDEALALGHPLFLKQWQIAGGLAGRVIDTPEWRGRQWLQQPAAAGWQPKAAVLARRCSARKCTSQVAPKLFMCPRHWRMVPPRLQAAIWRHYRPGQEETLKVSARYLAAAQAAIEAVAVAELGVQLELTLLSGGTP
jgi:protein gp37